MAQVSIENATRVLRYGAAAPTAGTWVVGDTILNSGPAAGDALGWRCVTAGTPGTWETLAAGSAPAVTVSAKYKAAGTTYNNTATLVDDADLQLPVVASGVYLLEAYIPYNASTAADVQLKWIAPTGSTLVWSPGSLASNATSTTSATGRSQLNLAQVATLGGIGVGTLTEARPMGLLTIGGTGGTFKAQMAQATADATDAIVNAGTWLRLSKVA